jgi:hypothetical protein
MFKQMKNIDTAFRQMRTVSIIVIISCMLICCYALFKSYRLVEVMQGKVYILSDGKALEALASDRKDNIGVEARDHVKTFHQLFFTLDPDDKVIQSNLPMTTSARSAIMPISSRGTSASRSRSTALMSTSKTILITSGVMRRKASSEPRVPSPVA